MIASFIHWNVDPVICTLAGIPVGYYGILFATGLVLSLCVLHWIFLREGLTYKDLEKLWSYALVGIVVGARLGHCLFYEPSYFLAHPLEMILPLQVLPNGGYHYVGYHGLASHGGAIGLSIALYFYTRKTKIALLDIVDYVGIVAPLAGGFIRLGNLMNSEILGMPSNKPWAFIFERVDNTPRHPAQLYEAIAYFIIFGVLVLLYQTQRKHLRHGVFLGLSFFLVCMSRIFIEYLKEDQVAFEHGMILNMGQLLSIPFIIVGALLIVYGLRRSLVS